LFQENSTIGQKITLSEAVVTVLHKMGYPSIIHAHQIQGGVNGPDFSAVFSVISWLIKKILERKEETKFKHRNLSKLNFMTNFRITDKSIKKVFTNISHDDKIIRHYRGKALKKDIEAKGICSSLFEFGIQTLLS
jgi:hypothetical protein